MVFTCCWCFFECVALVVCFVVFYVCGLLNVCDDWLFSSALLFSFVINLLLLVCCVCYLVCGLF